MDFLHQKRYIKYWNICYIRSFFDIAEMAKISKSFMKFFSRHVFYVHVQ